MNKIIFLVLFFVLVIPFSLGATLNGSSSIYTFNVTNCMANETVVGCNASSIRFSCDITNSAFIDFTEFQIDGVLYNASRVGMNWRYDFFKPLQNTTLNTSINFTRIYITDTNSDTAVFDEDNVSVLHDCVTCTDVGFADNCSVFDNTTFYHIFEPIGCQADFNETVSCNYCSEDLLQTLGECQVNDSQIVQYSDLNYFSCCAVTNLSSDCSILVFPFNETTYQNCTFFSNDLSCDFPSNVEFDERMNVQCVIPLTFVNESFSCVSKVLEDDRLLQVNPEFETYGTSLLSWKSQESKEFFTPDNRLLNVYFTNKNLVADKNFVFEVTCTSDQRQLNSSAFMNPFYRDATFVVARGVWLKDNAWFIIVGIFFALIITFWIGLMVRNILRAKG